MPRTGEIVRPGEESPQRGLTTKHTIERRGRRENRKLGKAEGRATESCPQRGVASGTTQVIERPEVGPKGETRGIERVKSHEFSRIGSGFAGEFHCRFYSCLFADFDSIAPASSPFGPTVGCSTSCPPRHSVVVKMCSAWEERRAEGDLGVPGEGKKIPAVTDSLYKRHLSVCRVPHAVF